MGYYTSYSLQCYGPEDKVKAFEEELLALSDNDPEVKELIEDGCVYAKLYELDKWIEVAALMFRDVLVCLSGDGEDSDDLWEQRWKGAESEFQKAVIPPFENENLKIK